MAKKIENAVKRKSENMKAVAKMASAWRRQGKKLKWRRLAAAPAAKPAAKENNHGGMKERLSSLGGGNGENIVWRGCLWQSIVA